MNQKNTKGYFRRPATFFHVFLYILLPTTFLFSGCQKNEPPAAKEVDLQLIADNFVSPIGVVTPPGDNRLFVIDQIGKIWMINANGTKASEPFLDISSKMVTLSPGYDERGLLGLAFHPNFKSNRRFYIFYTAPPRTGGPAPGVNWNNTNRVSEFTVSPTDPGMALLSSEEIILQVDDPQSNHNGGTIAFGPDGFLYISIGDGGGSNDVGPGHVQDWYPVNAGGNGQDIEANLMGNILRIDIDRSSNGLGYGIPASNPFVGKTGLDEIYAYGFRNPYRFSFDMGGSHQLYSGDAGQVLYEEIDIVTKGGNYGWNVKEGIHCFNTDNNLVERPTCPTTDPAGNPLIDPVIEMPNVANPKGGTTIAIVGGNVYRGSAIPNYDGKYIFGSLSGGGGVASGKMYLAKPTNAGLWLFNTIPLKSFPNDLGQYLKGFGQDAKGEIYVTTSTRLGPAGNTGKVYKLVPVN
jgi:glucose/arabinose dehydrogenase